MTALRCPRTGARGCDCAFHRHRRTYQRLYARTQRAATLAAQLATATRCPKLQGKHACGGPLRIDTTGDGRTVVVCLWCERQAKGVCRDCPRPVEGMRGRARRCVEHKRIFRNLCTARYVEANYERSLATTRATYQAHPEVRVRRNDYKRAWRKANPDKVRAAKQRYVARHGANPESAYNRYQVRYRKRHRLHSRDVARTKQQVAAAAKVVPPCTACGKKTGWTPVPGRGGRPWSTCMKCAWPGERKERRRTRREAAKRIAADPRFGLPPKTVRRPAAPAVRGPGFERLCLTPGCDIVVAHRKKKCTKCRQRDAELAGQQLEAYRRSAA